MSKTVMGIFYKNDEDVPDFGSIYLVPSLRGETSLSGNNEYGLNEIDVPKLALLTNALPGSTALCDDTGNLYRLTKNGWVKLGGE